MNPYRTYGSSDDPRAALYDRAFLGVDMREPSTIPAGWASSAVNYRFEKGKAVPRGGSIKPWRLVSADAVEIHGGGVFDDPDGDQWLLAALGGKVYRMREGTPAYEVPLASGITIAGRVLFVQAFDKLFALRGEGATPLILDDWAEGFREIDETLETTAGLSRGTGTEQIPNSDWAICWQNRLVVVQPPDVGLISDALNYTRYALYNCLRVNEGSGDKITGIWEFTGDALVVGKERSIHVVSGLTPNDYGNYTSAVRETLETQFGIVAARSVVAVGSDLWGLSQRGVVSVRQLATGKNYGVSLALSESIKPLIDRINWPYASGAVAAFHNHRYYLAVPLDDATIVDPVNVLAVGTHGAAPALVDIPAGWYRWDPADGESLTIDGTEYEVAADVYVGATSTVYLAGTKDAVWDGTLQHLQHGVNNAILVFSTEGQERDGGGQIVRGWEGHYTGLGLAVVDFMRATWGGKERLFALTADGCVTLLDEGFEDQVIRPGSNVAYTEVEVVGCPEVGETAKCGSAATITATADKTNTATTWGCADYDDAFQNFGFDRFAVGGFWSEEWLPAGAVWDTLDRGIRTYAQSWTTVGRWAKVLTVSAATPRFTYVPVVAELVTRGYHQADGSRSQFGRVELDLDTWHACFDVFTRTPAGNDTIAGNVLKDGRVYYAHGESKWVQSNTNDDHTDDGRQDYSVPVSTLGVLPGSGLDIDRHAASSEGYRAHAKGNWCCVGIRTLAGRVEVASAAVDYVRGQGRMGTKV